MKTILSLLFLAAVASVVADQVSYEDFSVVRIQYTASEKQWIDHVTEQLEANVWRDRQLVRDIMIKKQYEKGLLSQLRARGMKATVLIDDVQQLINIERKNLAKHVKKTDRAIDSTTYRDLEQLNAELDQLEADFSGMVSSYSAGTTIEGRSLRVEKVSVDGTDTKPVVWMDCGIHAREWVSQASCMYFLDQLTSLYGSDDTVTTLLDIYDFHILPVTNPDGYAYSWSTDRLWRKNRRQFDLCFGVDCNRNFDANFGGEGASDSPCLDTYHGETAFSEAESSGVRDALTSLGSRAKAVFSFHSFSQLWMTPYGYTHDLPADFDELMRVADVGVTALTAVYGTEYEYGSIANIIYVASGGSIDWTYDSLGILYSYAVELRDTGNFGFLLPEDQILPTAEETFAGITAAILAFE